MAVRSFLSLLVGLTPGPPVSTHAMEVLSALGPFLSRQPKLLVQVRDFNLPTPV
jgi:hypothetical protein